VTTKAEKSGKVLPNGNMADAHAEIGVIQQAYNAGKTAGASMELTVSGKAVCGHCRGDMEKKRKRGQIYFPPDRLS